MWRCHPASKRIMPAVVGGLVEGRLPVLVVAGVTGDHHMPHAPPAFGGFPGGCADARLPAHPRFAWPEYVAERAVLRPVLEQRNGRSRDHALICCYASTGRPQRVPDRVRSEERRV